MAKKQYEMTGALPIIVMGYGRVEPGAKPFVCEMEEEQEKFLFTIGAIKIRKEVAPEVPDTVPDKPSTAAWPIEAKQWQVDPEQLGKGKK